MTRQCHYPHSQGKTTRAWRTLATCLKSFSRAGEKAGIRIQALLKPKFWSQYVGVPPLPLTQANESQSWESLFWTAKTSSGKCVASAFLRTGPYISECSVPSSVWLCLFSQSVISSVPFPFSVLAINALLFAFLTLLCTGTTMFWVWLSQVNFQSVTFIATVWWLKWQERK